MRTRSKGTIFASAIMNIVWMYPHKVNICLIQSRWRMACLMPLTGMEANRRTSIASPTWTTLTAILREQVPASNGEWLRKAN